MPRSSVLHVAHELVESGRAEHGWSLPTPPDRAYESNQVFEVYHLLYDGAVVDLLSFRDMAFTNEILETAIAIPELGGLRFIRPELLIVTQFIRPDVRAAIAAIDLVAARQDQGGLDVEYAKHWARLVGREGRLEAALEHVDSLRRTS